jgi:hypothetical protein
MESTAEARARQVCNLIKRFAISSREPFEELKPHLWEAIADSGLPHLTYEEKCFKWEFLHITAMSWWAVNLAKLQLPAAHFKNAVACIEQEIGQWNAGLIECFSDLNGFVQLYDAQYQQITDPDEVVPLTKFIVGLWLLMNLTDKATFNDEAELAGMLGHHVYECIVGCWEWVV